MTSKYTDIRSAVNQELSSIVENYFIKRTCVISFMTEIGPKSGTANVIERNGKKYLLTCHHVYDEAIKYSKAICTSQSGKILFSKMKHIYSSKSDKLDFTILDFPLETKYAFPWNNFVQVPRVPKHVGFLTIGFPGDYLTKNGENKFSIKPLKYWTTVSSIKSISKYRFQVYLDYDKKLKNTDISTGTNLPDVPGMSGSLVVVPREILKGQIWSPEEIDIVGIVTGWDLESVQPSVIKATRGNWMRRYWK
jgi:hypothetical protein